jgi:hypothetical protein
MTTEKFDTTQSPAGAPSEADFQRIRSAKSHREAYPEQYAHPLVGKRVRATYPKTATGPGQVGTVERVVGSRFGQMVHLDTDEEGTFRLLSSCEVI